MEVFLLIPLYPMVLLGYSLNYMSQIGSALYCVTRRTKTGAIEAHARSRQLRASASFAQFFLFKRPLSFERSFLSDEISFLLRGIKFFGKSFLKSKNRACSPYPKVGLPDCF